MVPTQPQLDGLPLWAQLLISLLVAGATILIAAKGYLTKNSTPDVQAGDKQSAVVLASTIADMGAVRHLSDVCIRLSGCVDKLTDAIEDNTHHTRNRIDLDREIAQRMREAREATEKLREVMERAKP